MIRLLPVFLLFSLVQQRATSKPGLTQEAAKLLVENVPEVREARAAYRRPVVTPLGETADSYLFQVRSTMTRGSASGLIDNYQVDRDTGRVWRGMERSRGQADSFLLGELRRHLFVRSARALKTVDIRQEGLLKTISQSQEPIAYSLWGMTVGKLFSNSDSQLARGFRINVLKPNQTLGQPLTGYRVQPQAVQEAPIVEVYLGPENTIAEIYVEVAVFRNSFDWLFGEAFTDLISTIDVTAWKKRVGVDPIVEHSQLKNGTDALFIDFPERQICACVYKRPSGTVDPIFVTFYGALTPTGESLPDSLLRRKVSCIGS